MKISKNRFDFINKGYLTSLKKFRKNYIIPIEKERSVDILNNFKLITEPFILRRKCRAKKDW